MTEDQAHAVYDVLVAHAGANYEDRQAFVYHMLDGCFEWRFQGWLGFGGKLYVERRGLRVGYYPEHRTAARDAIVGLVNEKLAALRDGVKS